MILSSMSVMFITQRDPEAAVAQVAHEQVGEQERPEVADVGRPVDRRAAAVDPDVARLQRLERPRLPVSVSWSRTVTGSAPAIATAAAEMPRPAPSMPLQVAGRCLDVDASGAEPSSAAIASRIASRRPPAAAGRRRSSGRPMTADSPPPRPCADDRRDQLPLAMPRGVAGPAGRGGRGRPGRPRRAARRRSRGGRRRRPSGRAAGCAGNLDPAERERRPGPKG